MIPHHLERLISEETSFPFRVETGVTNQHRWYLLCPRQEELRSPRTFGIRTTLDWRRLSVVFEPGRFADRLLENMGKAEEAGRVTFRAVLTECIRLGAEVKFQVNGNIFPIESSEAWSQVWRRLELSLSKGRLELGTNDGEPDSDIIGVWTGRFAAAITAILPVEEDSAYGEEGMQGFPEGALSIVQSKRYERDRRNRAAAISIHGLACHACGLNLAKEYGDTATGFIEIHHTIPVSELGDDYVIDLAHDLVPLCPNCHTIAHRRCPPFSVQEIKAMLKSQSGTHTI